MNVLTPLQEQLKPIHFSNEPYLFPPSAVPVCVIQQVLWKRAKSTLIFLSNGHSDPSAISSLSEQHFK